MSSIILHAQPINVKSTSLPTQTSNANSIEVKSIRQKRLDDVVDASPPRNNIGGCGKKLLDVVDISPPRRNATIRGRVATPTRKKQDFIANKKRKKTSDDNLNAASKLATYVIQKGRVVFT
jgi:hypothetical protein